MPKLRKISAIPNVIKMAAMSPGGGDLIPGEAFGWRKILPKVHEVSQAFGYKRIETSPIEPLDIFSGNNSLANFHPDNLVRLETNSNKKFTLRPQNFLSVLRAYTTHRVFDYEKVTKWYYVEPIFSIEKNSFSHLYEFGAVNFGEPTSFSDAQLITMIKVMLQRFGINNVMFEINNKGCENCLDCYEEVLFRFLQQNKYDLCSHCQQLLIKEPSSHSFKYESVCGVFSCDNKNCSPITNSAPQIIDYLCAACNHQLTILLETLDELEIPYQLNPRLFGNSWFSHTIFRVNIISDTSSEATQLSLGIGGRQSRFVSQLTGQEIPALAFAVPLNVIWNLVENHSIEQKTERAADVFLINLGELAAKRSLRLFLDLWKNNITVAENFGENGIKNQFKLAEKKGCPVALIIGQKEALEGSVILRDVRCGTQEVFSYERIIDEVKKRLQD